MKKNIDASELVIRPIPQVVVSVRGKDGKNNALVVGFVANVSHDPNMVMIGIEPSRYSYNIVKETGCFVVNLATKDFRKQWAFLGSKSGRDMDKFKEADIKWEDGECVNAPILTDCPVNTECSVVTSILPENSSNELFIGKVEAIHVNEENLGKSGKILWPSLDLIHW